jgi:hypothetical protein
MPAKFAEVVKGLFRGGAPSNEDINMLRDLWGVNKIVSLDGDVADNIAPTVRALGMKHVVLDLGTGDDPRVETLKKKIVPSLLDDGPTYVHCKHGKDRTGMAVAMFRILTGWPIEKALAEAAKFGMGKGMPKDVGNTYYEAVSSFKPNQDTNDAADVVDAARETLQHNPAIDNSAISNPNQCSFSLPTDGNAPRISRSAAFQAMLRVNAWNALTPKVYCQCKQEDRYKKQLWFSSPQMAKQHANNSKLPLFSAEIRQSERVSAPMPSTKSNKALEDHWLSKGMDIVKFTDNVFLVLVPNNALDAMVEEEAGTSSQDKNDMIEVGIRDNYQGGGDSYIGNPGGGAPISGGFAGTTFLPFSNGL